MAAAAVEVALAAAAVAATQPHTGAFGGPFYSTGPLGFFLAAAASAFRRCKLLKTQKACEGNAFFLPKLYALNPKGAAGSSTTSLLLPGVSGASSVEASSACGDAPEAWGSSHRRQQQQQQQQ